MDSRAQVFVEVMIAFGVFGVAAFLIFLLARALGRRAAEREGARTDGAEAPHWIVIVLAVLLLALAAAYLIWRLAGGAWSGEGAIDWAAEPRALAFFLVMVAVAVIGLVALLAYVIATAPRRQATAGPVQGTAGDGDAEAGRTRPTPSAVRLLGLLALLVAFLLLNWIYLPRESQLALLRELVYPASFAVALVLLFDKASRAWDAKGGAEVVREWLFCDAIVVLLLLGYLNLGDVADPTAYAGIFWDVLAIALFFVVFWMLDRKTTRYRFLLAYLYLIALPILLVIWRTLGEVAVTEGLSWWSTLWPFLILTVIFGVLEVILLILPATAERHGVPLVKDILFVLIYAILLIAAIPAASG